MEKMVPEFLTNSIWTALVFAAAGLAIRFMYMQSKKAADYTLTSFACEYPFAFKVFITPFFLISILFVVINYGNIFGNWGIGKGSGIFTSIGFTEILGGKAPYFSTEMKACLQYPISIVEYGIL